MILCAAFSYVVVRADISDSMRWRILPLPSAPRGDVFDSGSCEDLSDSVPRDGVFNSTSCNDVLLASFLVELAE